MHLGQQLVVGHDGSRTRLTTREVDLLAYLAARPGQRVPRGELLEQVWGYAPTVVSRASDTTMTRLRNKIEPDPRQPVHLITEFGEGYRFEPLHAEAPVAVGEAERPVLRLGAATIDLGRRTVTRDGARETLTTHDVALLQILASADGAVVAVDDLLREVWGLRNPDRRSVVHVAVGRLRARIEADPSEPAHVLTVHGQGYRLALGAGAPTGRVTLVHARIHDGDGLSATAPQRWQRAVRRADQRLEALGRDAAAYLLRPTEGQWRLALSDPSAALRLCRDVQLALLDEASDEDPVERDGVVIFRGPALDLAVLEGEPEQTTDRAGRATYAGPEVGRVQCLVAAARPGQIVVDAATWGRSTVDGLVGVEVSLTELPGALPERTAVVAAPRALSARFAWWSDPRADWLALPVVHGRFVGRGPERAEVGRRLDEGRLVTLLGTGGIGKSRLALAVATERPPAAWADLRGARAERDVLEAIAAAIGVGLGDGGDPARLALRFSGPALLVLDEAEGAPEAVGRVVETLLREAPELRVLVTSRRALRLDAESTLELGPLPEASAAELLCDRMDRVIPADLAVRITGPVDGVPLAVELAAARARRLGAARVAERLDEGLAVLGSARGSGPRPTLRATLDWSLTLLPEAQHDAFAALGLLLGPTPLELVEALLDDEDAIEVVEALAEHSLVQLDDGTVDQYAVVRDHAARLAAELPDRRALEQRLVAWCARYGDPRFAASLERPGAAARRAELAGLRSHLRLALDLADDPDRSSRIALALGLDHLARGPASEGIAVCRPALAQDGLDEVVRAELEMCLGGMLRLRDPSEAGDVVRDAWRRFAAIGHPRVVVAARRAGQLLQGARRFDEAREVIEAMRDEAERRGEIAALWIARARLAELDGDLEGSVVALGEAARTADPTVAPYANHFHGRALEQAGDYAGARAAQQRALDGHLALGEVAPAALVHLTLASVEGGAGDRAAQRHHLAEGARLARTIGNVFDEGLALIGLGASESQDGELPAALEHLTQAVALMRDVAHPEPFAWALLELGVAHLLAGDVESAGRALDEAVDHADAAAGNVWVSLWGARAELEAIRNPPAAAGALRRADERIDDASVEAQARLHAHAVVVAVTLGEDPGPALTVLEALAEGLEPTSGAGRCLAHARAVVAGQPRL